MRKSKASENSVLNAQRVPLVATQAIMSKAGFILIHKEVWSLFESRIPLFRVLYRRCRFSGKKEGYQSVAKPPTASQQKLQERT